MTYDVRIIPYVGEGYSADASVGQPQAFTVNVGQYGVISDFPVEGWSGSVIEGQSEFIGKQVIITQAILGYNKAVVAYVHADGNAVGSTFSGRCRAKGLR